MTGDKGALLLPLLEAAVRELAASMDPTLIPGSGSDLAFALREARGLDEVAGVQGGIVLLSGRPHPAGPVALGAGGYAARVVLTAMKFDPGVRAAATIRYSPATLDIIEDLLLDTCSFDREKEPPGTSGMDWGVAFCCRSGVPDAIYDLGAEGREPLVRILAEDPGGVAMMIGRISARSGEP